MICVNKMLTGMTSNKLADNPAHYNPVHYITYFYFTKTNYFTQYQRSKKCSFL